jgi:predicted DNA-binding protein YlxM (UPF0122 family)
MISPYDDEEFIVAQVIKKVETLLERFERNLELLAEKIL